MAQQAVLDRILGAPARVHDLGPACIVRVFSPFVVNGVRALCASALDRDTSGLYREFHLKVVCLLDRKGWTLRQVFEHPTDEEEL